MTAIKEMTDEVKETVRVMNARADKEDPSRDMLIRTYKQVSNTHLEIIRRLEAGYKELSDAAIKQSQARRRDERPVVTQKEDLRWNTDTSRNELQAENTELKSEVETLQAENTKLKEEQTRLQHEAAVRAQHINVRVEANTRVSGTCEKSAVGTYYASDWWVDGPKSGAECV